MLAKSIVFSFITACASHPAPSNSNPDHPDEIQPKPGEGQHFCCSDIDKGEGCIAIGPEQINSCQNVLYCAASWQKVDGEVSCLP
jgi:hypothetical protein